MPRKRQESFDVSHLLNFSSGIPSDLPSTSYTGTGTTPQTRKANKKSFKKQQAERQERSVRDKLSSSFFLQASGSHAFVIRRKDEKKQKLIPVHHAGGGLKKNKHESEKKVKWDMVCVVKCLVPATATEAGKDLESSSSSCPICLDNLVAPRIAPCGHLFCYPCILRHLDSSSDSDKDSTKDLIGKCPCCYHLMLQKDLRPVEFITVQSPSKASSMEFRKLFRLKTASAPFIPSFTITNAKTSSSSSSSSRDKQQQAPTKQTMSVQTRVDPGDFPTGSQRDARYSRFNYIDAHSYREHFVNDVETLKRELENIEVMYAGISTSNALSLEKDKFYVTMATQAVMEESFSANKLLEDEHKINADFTKSQSKHRLDVLPYETAVDVSSQSQSLVDEGLCDSKSMASAEVKKKKGFAPGAMYMNEEMVQYYQASDGQLCFLSGFNLNCLSNEFSSKDPLFAAFSSADKHAHTTGMPGMPNTDEIVQKPPFPDVIRGQVIDVEHVHLTPDICKRMPCFSHLPLYSDITMVELDINGSLSEETRQRFKKDMKRRKEKRQAKKEAEKKADREARRKEEERIEELRKGIQRIDPNDPFFRPTSVGYEHSSPNIFSASDFTHSLTNEQESQPSARAQDPRRQPMNFSSACTAREEFPSIHASSETSFPSLSASLSTPAQPATDGTGSSWGSPSAARVRKGKAKGKKVVLFSTGGKRSYS